ncbi:MAG: M48 family metallopeptidase [Paludibacteraceae bacterium]|nr:M48 family metallopeptidase [Paludibacteraceae bacterium]
MKKLFLLGGSLLLSVLGRSANYQPMSCEGKMPEHMVRLLGEEKLSDDERTVQSLFQSGRVLYGTPVNAYIDSIANILYRANPNSEHEKIHIYLYKSPVANAFMCPDGSLFMNLGMVAQATSEAELALVLAHEIAHFDKKHGSSANKKDLKKAKSAAEYALKKTMRDREKEMEADSYAISDFYKKTNYSYEAVPGLFDLLQYSYLPFDEEVFQRSFVETADYKFPDEYYTSKLNPIVSREDYVDTLDTHPNLKKRRQNADDLVKNLNDDGRTEFLLSEASFDRARFLARKESVYLLLKNHDFGEAFYNTYVMMADNKDDADLQTFAAQALYGVAKYKADGDISEVVPDYKKTEGESGAAYYFLRKLKKKEVAVLALRFAWKAQKVNPDLAPITKSLMAMVRNYSLSTSDFCDFAMGTSVADAQKKVNALLGTDKAVTDNAAKAPAKPANAKPASTEKKNTVTKQPSKRKTKRNIPTSSAGSGETAAVPEKRRDSKYDNIRQKQAREKYVLPDTSFTVLNYMLVDLKADSAFVNMLSSTAKSDEKKDVEDALDELTNNVNKKAFEGGKVLLVTLYYGDGKSLARKDRQMQDNLMKWGHKYGIDFVCYEQLLKNNPNTKNYNFYISLKNLQYEHIAGSDKEMVSLKNPVLDSLLKKEGIAKMLDLRVVDMTKRRFKMHGIMAGVAVPYALPAVVAGGFIRQRGLAASVSLTDLETGDTDNKALLKASKYNTQPRLHQFLYQFLSNVKKGE